VLFSFHSLLPLLLLWVSHWVIPVHKTLLAYSKDGFGEWHHPCIKYETPNIGSGNLEEDSLEAVFS